jgi:hypothetical protein
MNCCFGMLLATTAVAELFLLIASLFASFQCYNISLTAPLTAEEAATLAWLLRETFEPELLTPGSEFGPEAVGEKDTVVEVGLLLVLRLCVGGCWLPLVCQSCPACWLEFGWWP